jgi:transposase-like protein
MSKGNRVFTAEFRVQVAQRILDGESVSKLQQELAIKRSVLYRWRDYYRKEGAAGLNRPPGRTNPLAGSPNTFTNL